MRALAFMGTAFSLLPGMSRTNPYLTIDDRYNITTAPTQSSLSLCAHFQIIHRTSSFQIEKQTSKHDNQKVVIQTLTRLGKDVKLLWPKSTNGFKMRFEKWLGLQLTRFANIWTWPKWNWIIELCSNLQKFMGFGHLSRYLKYFGYVGMNRARKLVLVGFLALHLQSFSKWQ